MHDVCSLSCRSYIGDRFEGREMYEIISLLGDITTQIMDSHDVCVCVVLYLLTALNIWLLLLDS